MMTDLTDEQRARALEMWRAAVRADGVSECELPDTITEGLARYWLAAEAHVLASHTCQPEPEPDPRVGLLEGVCLREGVVLTRSDAALLLSIADAAAPRQPLR